MTAIARAAERTRLVIFGEEHHLPQTRSLYEAVLQRLWDAGYRWLAAETFAPVVMDQAFAGPDYRSGYYVKDTVFASAVRTALKLGYKLVAYDTSERGPDGDGSFRGRTQAQNQKRLVSYRDQEAKLLVFAGHGHAAEVPPADGWTPMASVLKQFTGIDPFTGFAPTMSQRLTAEEEDPMCRQATARDLVREPVVFVDGKGALIGSDNCDCFVFWPRMQLIDGRPDWLVKTMGRKPVAMPELLRKGTGLRLVQAFLTGEPGTAVPLDQALLRAEPKPKLRLPHGSFWLRTLDARPDGRWTGGPAGEVATLRRMPGGSRRAWA